MTNYKHILILLFSFSAAVFAPANAQEKYSAVLAQSKQLSPYEAIYLLMDYQQWKPEMPAVYYELGNLTYDLLPTRDPLHHYTELSTLLYRSRLFYGNCLHFANDQKLPGWQFEELANGQKKIEYEQLDKFIRPRLAEVQRQQIACDSIHRSFVRMTERYNRCRTLFADFLSRYTREKTAHLHLQPEEQQTLLALQKAADSLDTDIAQYQGALTLQPIPGYAPTFRKESIVLYRLDGLTYTDFLQNDIVIWDYSRWVSAFLNEQHEVYDVLYTDIERELKNLRVQVAQYEAGKTIQGRIDASLIGRCDRLELATPQVDSVRAMQQTVLNGVAEQTIAQSAAPKTIREMIPLLQVAAERSQATPDSAILKMNDQLIAFAQPLRIQQQPTYTHPISGDIIRYETMPGEEVFCLLPDERGYRCVLIDEEGATCVRQLTRELGVQRRPLRRPEEKPLLFSKIPGNSWVLITDKNVYYLP